ncbi:MAG: cell division topological specificity factor MinE [Deinococcus sp.]|nr:cell division topological specificity factor MinE [Deinococcus sp.]
MLFWRRNNSAQKVRDRLKFVLTYDRAKMSPGLMERLRADLVEVVKRYFPADPKRLTTQVDERGDKVVLTVDIPFGPSY